jgi:hypothetical protein
MDTTSQIVRAELPGGSIIRVETTLLSGDQDVGLTALPFMDVTTAIEQIAVVVIEPLKRVKPRKASVEFGIEIALESGQLTALLVKGSSVANLKITLEWEDEG